MSSFVFSTRAVRLGLALVSLVSAAELAADTWPRAEVEEIDPVLSADFEDRAIGELGNGGAEAGEPAYRFGQFSAEVMAAGPDNQALRLTKTEDSSLARLANWRFLEALDFDSGKLSITFDITPRTIDFFAFTVRNSTFSGPIYIQLGFDDSGQVDVSFPASGSSSPASYVIDQQYSVEIDCDIDLEHCSVKFDDTMIAEEVTFPSTITDPAIGGFATGFTGSAAVGAQFDLDDLTVTATAAPSIPVALAFDPQPGDIELGQSFQPTVGVQVLNAFDQPATTAADVTLELLGGSAETGLSGASAQSDVETGVARFESLELDEIGSGYQLEASLDAWENVTAVSSVSFDVLEPSPSTLRFSEIPASVVADRVVAPAIEVAVEDASGDPVVDGTPVTLGIFSGPASGASLSGTTVRATSEGVAVFDDLVLNPPGEYVLQAETDNNVSETSPTVEVLGDRIFHDRMEVSSEL
ncbi:hypothetical protein [Wenzhouxiangella sp. EGI_FJ10305]|uniref:hypothetical protein n=1 Tax=Wenzhouxiangella sp. EGI_FJ10305 TaxID=3243768 RepID=UPI0035D546E0